MEDGRAIRIEGAGQLWAVELVSLAGDRSMVRLVLPPHYGLNAAMEIAAAIEYLAAGELSDPTEPA